MRGLFPILGSTQHHWQKLFFCVFFGGGSTHVLSLICSFALPHVYEWAEAIRFICFLISQDFFDPFSPSPAIGHNQIVAIGYNFK